MPLPLKLLQLAAVIQHWLIVLIELCNTGIDIAQFNILYACRPDSCLDLIGFSVQTRYVIVHLIGSQPDPADIQGAIRILFRTNRKITQRNLVNVHTLVEQGQPVPVECQLTNVETLLLCILRLGIVQGYMATKQRDFNALDIGNQLLRRQPSFGR